MPRMTCLRPGCDVTPPRDEWYCLWHRPGSRFYAPEKARREDPAFKALDDQCYPPELQVGKGPRFYTPPAGWGIRLRPEEVRTHSIVFPPALANMEFVE